MRFQVEVAQTKGLLECLHSRNLLVRRRVSFADLIDEPSAILPYDSILGAFNLQVFHSRGLAYPRTVVFTRSVQM
jgi:hypothetical protein